MIIAQHMLMVHLVYLNIQYPRICDSLSSPYQTKLLIEGRPHANFYVRIVFIFGKGKAKSGHVTVMWGTLGECQRDKARS